LNVELFVEEAQRIEEDKERAKKEEEAKKAAKEAKAKPQKRGKQAAQPKVVSSPPPEKLTAVQIMKQRLVYNSYGDEEDPIP
jgi:hypothetical protein